MSSLEAARVVNPVGFVLVSTPMPVSGSVTRRGKSSGLRLASEIGAGIHRCNRRFG